MTKQSETLALLRHEISQAIKLKKSVENYKPSGTYNARNDGKAWATSEQYAKTIERIKQYARELQ
jgi:hypothetical protein